jgi:hypothetical protein
MQPILEKACQEKELVAKVVYFVQLQTSLPMSRVIGKEVFTDELTFCHKLAREQGALFRGDRLEMSLELARAFEIIGEEHP